MQLAVSAPTTVTRSHVHGRAPSRSSRIELYKVPSRRPDINACSRIFNVENASEGSDLRRGTCGIGREIPGLAGGFYGLTRLGVLYARFGSPLSARRVDLDFIRAHYASSSWIAKVAPVNPAPINVASVSSG